MANHKPSLQTAKNGVTIQDRIKKTGWLRHALILLAMTGVFYSLYAAHPALAQIVSLDLGAEGDGTVTGRVIQLVALLTVLSLAPSILIMMTSFTRIVVVLSFLRTAIGIQQTPPNTVMISLALFLTFFIMAPTFEATYDTAIKPLINEDIEEVEAFERGELGEGQTGVAESLDSDPRLLWGQPESLLELDELVEPASRRRVVAPGRRGPSGVAVPHLHVRGVGAAVIRVVARRRDRLEIPASTDEHDLVGADRRRIVDVDPWRDDAARADRRIADALGIRWAVVRNVAGGHGRVSVGQAEIGGIVDDVQCLVGEDAIEEASAGHRIEPGGDRHRVSERLFR